MRALYGLLLYLYPPAFRRAYGREMLRVAAAMAGRQPRAIVAGRLLLDLIRSVPREWRDDLRRSTAVPSLPTRGTGDRMHRLLDDVRFALRHLARSPGFTAAAVATLALGIGANTAIVSLADATLLRPVRVRDPHEMRAWSWSTSYPDFREYERRTDLFAGAAAVSHSRVSLAIDGAPELRTAAFVSGGAFDAFGIRAAPGRTLLPADDAGPGGPVVGVLSHDYWRARFSSDAGVVGRTITANGTPVTIVGVAEAGFRGTSLSPRPVIFLPLTSVTQVLTGFFGRPMVLEYRGLVWLDVFVRLRPGVSEAQAAGEAQALYRRLHPPPPGRGGDEEQLVLRPLAATAIGDRAADVRAFVLLLAAVSGLTLVIGCANLANLLLARAAQRRRELAVRLALGASRGAVVLHLLIETLVLGALGGAAGMAVAAAALPALAAWQLPGGVPIGGLDLALDGRALAVAAALTLGASLLFGAAPAWQAARGDLLPALRQDDRTASGRSRLRGALVAAQVAVSLVLLAGAGLFLRSLLHALDLPLGFSTRGVAAASVNLGLARYDVPRALAYYDEALARVQTLPGVTAAAWTTVIPTRGDMSATADVDGYVKRGDEEIRLRVPQVGPGYFAAAGIPILRGRPFLASDPHTGPGVVVLSRAAADQYWPGRDPVGGRLRFSSDGPWLTVVGVCENTVIDRIGEPAATIAYLQFGRTSLGGFSSPTNASHLLVRTSGDASALVPSLREVLRAIDPRAPVYSVQPFEQHVAHLLMPQRMGTTLFAGFGVLALTLAAIGIYGVTSYVAVLRRRELAIRLALGADARAIRRLVLLEGLRPLGAGVAAGLVAALWTSGLTAAFMHGVEPRDAATLAAVTLGLSGLALLASYMPARRAGRADPAQVLKVE